MLKSYQGPRLDFGSGFRGGCWGGADPFVRVGEVGREGHPIEEESGACGVDAASTILGLTQDTGEVQDTN